MGRALLSKALIQLSSDGWGCAPYLVVSCFTRGDLALGFMGGMVRLMVTSRSIYANRELPRELLLVPCPCGELLQTHTSTGDSLTLADSFGSVSCGVTTPFLWVLVHTRFCLCPSRLEPLFSLALWKSCNQIPVAFKDRFPGVFQSLCRPQARKPDVGFWTFTTVGELLWYYCSLVCGLHTL